MPISLEDKLKKLPASRQKSIEKRAKELIAEEMTLRDLRIAMEKTQQELCELLHMKQDGISRLERRSDMLLSTLEKYVEALGGTITITAQFPDRAPVIIKHVHDIGLH